MTKRVKEKKGEREKEKKRVEKRKGESIKGVEKVKRV
jgi:hypothetical protein